MNGVAWAADQENKENEKIVTGRLLSRSQILHSTHLIAFFFGESLECA